ncbi:hypothetical protein CL657_05110 [bacterium]|nr:hypothetical protein [bacterium]
MTNIIIAISILIIGISSYTDAVSRKAPLIGKRYFNLSYGLSNNKSANSISLARLGMNLPITNKLDLGFGSFQGWRTYSDDQETKQNQHDYSFFTNLKYHFLPKSIINPFIIIEMGQVIQTLQAKDNTNMGTSSGLLFINESENSHTFTAIQYYYSIGLGEQLIIKDKTCFSMSYNFGVLKNKSYQHFIANIGHWILEDVFLDLQFKSHINTSANEFHLISYILF